MGSNTEHTAALVESLAMDLKRFALAFHRGSMRTAEVFKQEALKREGELERQEISIYLKKLLKGTREALSQTDTRMAEDALMYSTLLQNFRLTYFK